MVLRVGIDTGGTFTDVAAVAADGSVVATAKAATTHHDLAVGVIAALRAILATPEVSAVDVALVSLSTTLATNALVEGHGAEVGLVAVGFTGSDLERITNRIIGEPQVSSPNLVYTTAIAGGHDALGVEQEPLDVAALDATEWPEEASAYAVVGQFAVRNPSHELAVAVHLQTRTGKPVTCSHELSSRLDGPGRAHTAVLNAGLIAVVDRLRVAVARALEAAGVRAPVMMTKGDGSLASVDVVAARPIETILSGPAAGVVGVGHLLGPNRILGDAILADMGGTTTDLTVMVGGEPRISDGAEVAGRRTMVEAVEVVTHGLGGDSEVRSLSQSDAGSGGGPVLLGPARAVPLSRLALERPEVVELLERQLAEPVPRDGHGRFVVGLGPSHVNGDAEERLILEAVADGLLAEVAVTRTSRGRLALARLRRRGVVRVACFTPTDAAVLLGHHGGLDAEPGIRAARAGAALLARTDRSTSGPHTTSADAVAAMVHDLVVARIIDRLLEVALRADGLVQALPGERTPQSGEKPTDTPLVQAALGGHRGFATASIGVGVPIVALGAAAGTYYPEAAASLGADLLVPPHAEVANAVGAAVGRIRVERQVTISRPRAGQFVLHIDGQPSFVDLDAAKLEGEQTLGERVRALAVEAGAVESEVAVHSQWAARTATVNGRELLIEGTVTVTAEGPPALRP